MQQTVHPRTRQTTNAQVSSTTERPRSPLGAHSTWVVHGGLVGAVAAWALQATLLGDPFVFPGRFVFLYGAFQGLVLGALGRAFLNETRGRLSIGQLAIVVPLLAGTTAALLSAWTDLVISGTYYGAANLIPGVHTALMAGLLWLPYTMATVMRWPRWPVGALAVLTTPVVLFLTLDVITPWLFALIR